MKYVLQDEIEGYGKFRHEKILIVDDNDTNLFVVKTILEDRGLTVDTALSGSEGVARFEYSEEFEYKMVFLDINMYDMDGYKVSEKIRGLDRKDSKKVPIYALSANIFAKDRNKAKRSGMNGYVTKPINYKELFALIRETIEEKEHFDTNTETKQSEIRKEQRYDLETKDYILDNLGQHFVFNALNTIKGAVITNSEQTCSMINDLSDYMQYRLNTLRKNRLVSLRDEIRHLKAYSRLEMARFSYISINIEEEKEYTKNYKIPAMSLIFLVENSVHHGVLPLKDDREKRPEISVTTEPVGEDVLITIKDNGTGFEKTKINISEKFGGLAQIEQQMKEMCRTVPDIESKAGAGTKIKILLANMEEYDV